MMAQLDTMTVEQWAVRSQQSLGFETTVTRLDERNVVAFNCSNHVYIPITQGNELSAANLL